MNTLTCCSAAALVFVANASLSTDYSHERSLRVESESELRMETTTTFERDGQPQERQSSSTQKRHTLHVDKLLEHDDNTPKKVRRHFVELKNETSASFGDQEFNDEHAGALVDVTLELTRGDGDGDDVKVEVVDGAKPKGESLEGHKLELALDALLPESDVKAGEEWDVDAAGVKRALGFDLSRALFPPPEPEGGQGGSGGSGGGRGRWRGPGGGQSSFLQLAEWECKATLKDGDEDFQGTACAVIELKISAEGELPEPEGGPGGGRSERAFGAFGVFGAFGNATSRVENSYEVQLEGRLLFDRAHRMPVHLSLEGKLSMENHTEFKRDDNTIKFDSESTGELAYEVTVSLEKAE